MLSNPEQTVLDRRFNVCQILKTKNKFRNLRDLIAGRTNYPLICPAMKGLMNINFEYRHEDAFLAIKAINELRQVLPPFNFQNMKYHFDIRFTAITKIQNVVVTGGAVNVKNFDLK